MKVSESKTNRPTLPCVIDPCPQDNDNILATLTHALLSLVTPHPNQGGDLLEKIRDLLGHAKQGQE